MADSANGWRNTLMNIVFLTLAYPSNEGDRNIYSDLMDEFTTRGHKVTVFSPDESRSFGHLRLGCRKGVELVGVPTGKITKTRLLAKAVNTLLIEGRFARAILAVCPRDINLLVYSTPPINFVRAVHEIKKRTGCTTYLLLKDIFPQNAVDLHIIRAKGPLWFFFRAKEKKLYGLSDHIGCMSPANANYCESHNPDLPRSRIHVCPNSIRPTMEAESIAADISSFYSLGILPGKLHLIYGGNLGKPQCIDYIIQALSAIDNDIDVFTTIIGNGTEYPKLAAAISSLGLARVKLLPFLPKEEYRRLLSAMDVGLVFLDPHFTIPNFPSRILDYMDCSIPMLACTDIVCDLKAEVCDEGGGVWCKSGDIDGFVNAIAFLKEDAGRRKEMGQKAHELLKKKYSVDIVSNLMLERLTTVH
jgi:glycosyltransferase involved in cell wall biosynthesis